MNFGERVNELLDEQYKSGKELAIEANFSLSNISKGKKDGNVPAADTACRIAKCLRVSVEYLINGFEHSETTLQKEASDYVLFNKYNNLIKKINNLSPKAQKALSQLIENLQGM